VVFEYDVEYVLCFVFVLVVVWLYVDDGGDLGVVVGVGDF